MIVLESADALKSWEEYRIFVRERTKRMPTGEPGPIFISKTRIDFDIRGKAWKGHALVFGKKARQMVQKLRKDGILFVEGVCQKDGKQLVVSALSGKYVDGAMRTFERLKLPFELIAGQAEAGATEEPGGDLQQRAQKIQRAVKAWNRTREAATTELGKLVRAIQALGDPRGKAVTRELQGIVKRLVAVDEHATAALHAARENDEGKFAKVSDSLRRRFQAVLDDVRQDEVLRRRRHQPRRAADLADDAEHGADATGSRRLSSKGSVRSDPVGRLDGSAYSCRGHTWTSNGDGSRLSWAPRIHVSPRARFMSLESPEPTPPQPGATRTPRIAWLAVLLIVALGAVLPRGVRGMRHTWSSAPAPPAAVDGSDFFSSDPDGMYHMRRVERALAEGSVAGEDPYLAFPKGSAIPWPPYYDRLLAWSLAPFAPEDEAERHRLVERWVATVPFLCAILTAVVVALAAGALAGPIAALCAGLHYAWTEGAIMYGMLGVGDHHAWIALLLALSLFGASRAFARLDQPRGSVLRGVALGLLAGLALGSWVAALVHVMIVQAALGWLLIQRSRRELPGLPAFGCAYHLTTLATVFPAILASPWTTSSPWMVVNLSWFHAAQLAVGALVFVPLLVKPAAFATGTRAARLWPVAFGATLAIALGLAALLDIGPGAGIREAFAWASRTNEFMDSVRESLPLVGAGAENATAVFTGLGWLAPLALIGWFGALRRTFWQRADCWLPWAIAFPVFVSQALSQRRFANALALPLAVLIGTLLARRTLRIPRPIVLVLALAIPLVSFGPQRLWERVRIGYGTVESFWGPPRADFALGDRMLFEWLRTENTAGHGTAVMAYWDGGHAIEWIAGRPSVATNFGNYVGADSFAAPARFFLAETEAEAVSILAERRARYVVVTRKVFSNLPMNIRIARPGREAAYFDANGLTRLAQSTMAAGLVPHVIASSPGGQVGIGLPFGRLRLVHVSPVFQRQNPDPRSNLPMRSGWIWELVPGAVVDLIGEPGATWELALDLEYRVASYKLQVRFTGTLDASGRGRVLVPYATNANNGDGRATGPLRWKLGERTGNAVVPRSAVMNGSTLTLP